MNIPMPLPLIIMLIMSTILFLVFIHIKLGELVPLSSWEINIDGHFGMPNVSANAQVAAKTSPPTCLSFLHSVDRTLICSSHKDKRQVITTTLIFF